MLTKINYQKELDKLIDHLQKEEKVPTLLLHSAVLRAAVMYWSI